jgi:putative redox protein
METTIRYLDGVRFEVTARGHRLVCDQPRENNGADAGMSPPELLLASLGACAGYYAAEYLRARGLPADGLTVRVTAEKAMKPARIASFRIDVEAPSAEDPRHKDGIFRAVHHCLIHNTLLNAPSIEIHVESPSIAA